MKTAGIVVICYGIIVLLGGLIGFLTKGSVASLAAGGVSGLILIICAFGIFKRKILPFFGAIFLSVLLTLFFAYRFYKTGVMMPAGSMSLLSFLVCVFLLTAKSPKSNMRP